MRTCDRGFFRTRDLVKAAPEMNRASAAAFSCSPRNRAAECIIDFEHSGSITIALQLLSVGRGHLRGSDSNQLTRRYIQNRERRNRHSAQVFDGNIQRDFAAKGLKMFS